MKALYLDIFSGVSGDMFIGALLDLGVDFHQFEHELEKLHLHGYHLHIKRAKRFQIEGTKFDVHLEHEHGHSHGHTHEHEHGHSHSHEHHHDDDPPHEHEHGHHHHEHDHDHGHHHHEDHDVH